MAILGFDHGFSRRLHKEVLFAEIESCLSGLSVFVMGGSCACLKQFYGSLELVLPSFGDPRDSQP